jgi:nicotinate phosphoribosyltransferase
LVVYFIKLIRSKGEYMYHVSILDTDLYKLTQQHTVLRLFPNIQVRYDFINRDNREFPEGFGEKLKEIVNGFKDLKINKEEKDFIREKCYYLPTAYIDYIKGYQYDPAEVNIEQVGTNLKVWVKGYWFRTILWEVPLMATISELYFKMTHQTGCSDAKRLSTNQMKAEGLAEIHAYYSEFGTRRRFSYANQNHVIEDLKEYGQGYMIGTSNLHFAMKYNLIPMGTIAHEMIQAHGAMYGFQQANAMAMESWVQVYQGDLGIALTDTFTTDVFLKAFNTKYAKLFDGVRHDSSNPFEFIDKIVNHYKKLRINPMHKTALFSDSINSLDIVRKIHEACEGKIQDRYGIGTWLSNDVGVKPLNIVIKLTSCDFGQGWIPTVKLSDSKTKHTGDVSMVNICKQTLGIQE